MKKYFPATLDGLGSAIAYKRLHPRSKVFLNGKANDILKHFPQFKEVPFFQGTTVSHLKSDKTLSYTAKLVLEMKKRNFYPSQEDAELFACAIYYATNALTREETTPLDLESLKFCFEHGGTLSKVSVKISFFESLKTAREIMTSPVKSVLIDMNISEVTNLIQRTGFTGFPVVNKENEVIGVITKKDAERALKAGIEELQLVMSIPPIVVDKKASLEKIGELMAAHDVGRIIVVDENMKAIGIITRRDLVRAVASLQEENKITLDVSDELERNTPPLLFSLLKEIGNFAQKREERAYAVGGFVRDLLLGRKSLDVDIVIEGNGSEFAEEFAKEKGVKLRAHPAFKTATLFLDGISVDIATARTEYYENPGRLPKVESSNLRKDLYRRDFTINAMAISLNPQSFGTLIDFFGGRKDLKAGIIRVLHNMSFVEDPTRILRALRYAARFKYKLEEKTETLLESAINHRYLNSVSASRIRREFEKSLKVKSPEDVFEMFQSYGVLEIFPCKREVDFHKYFEFVRNMKENFSVLYSIILLLLKPCQSTLIEDVFKKYGVPRKFLEVFKKIYNPHFLEKLKHSTSNSSLYFTLEKIPNEALPILAYEDENVKEKVLFFIKYLKNVHLEKVSGELLKSYGLNGVKIGRIMKEILKLKLDDNVDEFEALKRILKGDNN